MYARHIHTIPTRLPYTPHIHRRGHFGDCWLTRRATRTRMRPARDRTPHTCAAPSDRVCATWGGRARGRVACLGVAGAAREVPGAPARSCVRQSQRASRRRPPRGLRGGTGVGTSRHHGTCPTCLAPSMYGMLAPAIFGNPRVLARQVPYVRTLAPVCYTCTRTGRGWLRDGRPLQE